MMTIYEIRGDGGDFLWGFRAFRRELWEFRNVMIDRMDRGFTF